MGGTEEEIFFFFCYSESLLWSWQWKSQNVSKLSLVFTISWNNNVKCNTKSMVIKHQKFFSLLDVIIYVWCMEKNVFRKTCITYSVLEYIETMNATFTLSWQSYITSSRYLKKWKILLKIFWQTQKVCRMLNIFLLPKLTCRQNNGPSPSSWIVVAILLCLTNSTPSDSSLRYI